MVVGRYEMLGAGWGLAPNIPSFYEERPLSEDDRRTHLGWFHITSMPSGEGFQMRDKPKYRKRVALARD